MSPWPFRRRETDPPLGQAGERLAQKHLRRKGLKILARNYRCPAGEADLVALDPAGPCLVFVEVKTRSRDDQVLPESAVDADKQRRLRNIARYYCSHHETNELSVRFDVVAVCGTGRKANIRHIPEAF